MKSNIQFPSSSLPKKLTEYITNIIKLINGEQTDIKKCFPDDDDYEVEYRFFPDAFLSDINDCLLLVKKDPDEKIKEMWDKFQSNGYDCTNIFFKIVFLYYKIKHEQQHTKKTTVNKSKMKSNLKKLKEVFEYLQKAEDIELKNSDEWPYCAPLNTPEYKAIFDKNGDFIDKEQDRYCHRFDYKMFLCQMSKIITKIENNIKYKCSDVYSLYINASYTGIRQKQYFNDKSIIMIKSLYLFFNTEFGQPYNTYITAIVNVLFPNQHRDAFQVNEILRSQSNSMTKLKKLEKSKKI